MLETTAPTEKRCIVCQDGTYPFLLGHYDERGVWFWCKWHKMEHLKTWEELEALRRSFPTLPPEAA